MKAAVALVVVLAAGLWVLGALVAGGYEEAILLNAAWFAAVAVGVYALSRRVPSLRRPLGTTFALVTVFSLAAFWFTTIRETEVNERLDQGVPASQLPAAERPDVEDLLAPQP